MSHFKILKRLLYGGTSIKLPYARPVQYTRGPANERKVEKETNHMSLKPTSLVCCISVNKCGLQEQIYEVLLHATIFMRATRGAGNPNLQVVIAHASYVCSQHSFGIPLRMYGMHRTHARL